MVEEIKDSDFSSSIKNSSTPVVVDFWASWCGPCKMLSPVIEEVSDEMQGKAKFFKLNVDENPVTAAQFKIASIPTVMVFKDGNIVDKFIGFRPKDTIKDVLKKHV
ncbi:thioredoxin [Clostridium sp. MT-14]|jgi:thioredoxin 1|uniref:Thioredoxin n=1 Tax=Clostridium aromativorans TaxID=2836848 RepID=A0ABS8N669_9CLOT|nr:MULTISPECIES: thioredoxin [Clostridium]KAA8680588.1 thioredoxin [Clostridium sp. HV4-5-A1G]MCC9295311.1 thioredoxin [Clostridium aromativorans]CAB1261713.1 Thioredoxin [Clostridiaceae bacterium BL-3]